RRARGTRGARACDRCPRPPARSRCWPSSAPFSRGAGFCSCGAGGLEPEVPTMRDGIRRGVGHGVLIAGASLLVCAASVAVRGRIWQERHADLFATATAAGAPGSRHETPAARQPRRGEALALLRVPRLGIETV